jgi:DNA-binding response OmpR family regulator
MKTILLIEDNDNIRENLVEIMELANYKVLSAADGEQGVVAASKYLPDLIVCDIMMPKLDGFGVLQRLRADPQLQHIPIIFLTAKSEPSEKRMGLESGAFDYIIKPIGGQELLDSIENYFSKKG